MAGGDWKDWKLLVVDSDKEFLDWVVSVFKWAGGRDIRSADSPQQAMELLQTFKADGALIGIQLKGMSGVEYLSRLRNRQISSNPDLPVIMVISTADRNALRNACQIGIENFVPKPVDAETLVKRVASTILAPRRFIANRWYFGPDRRRRQLPFEGKDRRRVVIQQRQPGPRPERSLEDMVAPLVDPAAPKEVRRSSLEGVSLVDPAVPRAPGRDIGPLVEAPQAKIARDAGPLVEAPVAAVRQSRDIGPLVESKVDNGAAWKEEMAAQEAARAAAAAAA
jgi:two-component system chemotaxis response regulator CheY